MIQSRKVLISYQTPILCVYRPCNMRTNNQLSASEHILIQQRSIQSLSISFKSTIHLLSNLTRIFTPSCLSSSPTSASFLFLPFLACQNAAQLKQQRKSIKYYFNKIFPITYSRMTETRKATDVFQKSRANKSATLSHLEQQVGGALLEAINHLDAENKKLCGGVYITKATEHTYQKDKQFILIQVNYRSSKLLLTPVYKKLVTELEKKLKKTVLVLSTRKIQSRWVKENKTQTRPNSRTLTAVYNAFLDELLLPGVIIGSRTRVRLDGSSFTKIVLDKTEQHFLEERVDAIKAAYKNLTHRDIEIDFQKESTYYTLKKGDRR